MANLTKSDANRKYDQLREQLNAGTLSQRNFKAAANRIYKMYHGKANAATRNKVSQPPAKAKAVATKSRPSPKAQPSATAKPTKPSPVQPAQPSNTTKPKPEKPVVRGKFLDSNPPLKSQPKKPKRSSFPAGRSGARSYAAALAKYRKLLARIPKIKRKKPQRRGTAFR